jgi:hypothetical protein
VAEAGVVAVQEVATVVLVEDQVVVAFQDITDFRWEVPPPLRLLEDCLLLMNIIPVVT